MNNSSNVFALNDSKAKPMTLVRKLNGLNLLWLRNLEE